VTGGYTVAVTGYTSLDKPGGTKITLPAAEAPLPTTYQTTYAYSVNTQQLTSQTDPRTQGLLGETITYSHDVLGNPTRTYSSAQIYVDGTVYTNYNEPSQITLGASTNPATITYAYDDQTRRLTDRLISRTQAPGPQVDDTSYTYDAAGNPLTTTDKQSETGNTATDSQCYQYDTLARLSQAWTAKTACPAQGTDPTATTVANTAGSYWQTYNYDAIGDRTQVVDHSTTGGADSTTTYTNGCTTGCNTTGTQPHTLTATSGGSNPTSFVYDAAGNLLTRAPTSGGPGQKLVWDDEDRLAEVDATGSSPTTTKYLYDADGNQLIRRDPGRSTLFAGDTEIVVNTSATPNVLLGAVRTYTHGGSGPAIAVSSSLPGGGTDYLFTDPHGTAELAMDTTTQQVSRQQYTPYGQQRASTNGTTWPDSTHTACGVSGFGRNDSGNPLVSIDDNGDIFPYTSGGFSYCFIVCGGFSVGADGHAYATVGAFGFGGYGHFGAAASAKSNDQSWFSVGTCVALGIGGCIQAGTRQHSEFPKYSADQAGDGDWWLGGSYAPGEGAFAGMNFTFEIH
jgi:YD repeat-containing protein